MVSRNEELRQSIQVHMGVRLLFATALLVAAYGISLSEGASIDTRSAVLTVLIVALFTVTLVFGLMLRTASPARNLVPLAAAQIAVDGAIVGGLALVTGGAESVFIFVWYLNIFSGANLLQLRGALSAAMIAAVILFFTALIQVGPLAAWAPGWLFPEEVSQRVNVATVLLNIGAFGVVGALTGVLSERLRSTRTALESTVVDAAALRKLHAHVVSTMPVGLLTTDARARITFINPAALAILAPSMPSPAGHLLREIAPFLSRDALRRDGISQELELRADSGDLRVLGVQVVPLGSEGESVQGHLWLLTDLTELRRLQERLAREAHLAAIGKLSAAIAHEIRNPLAAISGSIQLLTPASEGSPEARLHGIVKREVLRLNGLVEQFLDYARPREPQFGEVDLLALVEEARELFEMDDTLRAPIRVHRPSIAEPVVVADSEQIRQVVWNLLRNAAQAGGEGTEIDVHFRHGNTGDPPRATWTLSVRDTGSGLSPEVFENLFQPFFTTKAQGTGLGLATCYQIAKAHAGSLEANNRTDGVTGAEFRLQLPIGELNSRSGVYTLHRDSLGESLQPVVPARERAASNTGKILVERGGP